MFVILQDLIISDVSPSLCMTWCCGSALYTTRNAPHIKAIGHE